MFILKATVQQRLWVPSDLENDRFEVLDILLGSFISYMDALEVHTQGATIRLPDYPGQSIFGSGNHDLQKSCLTGQVQIISKLILSLSHIIQTSKIILIS